MAVFKGFLQPNTWVFLAHLLKRMLLTDVADLPENKPVAKLCSLILFEDSVREHALVKIVDSMILSFMQDIDLTPSFLRMKIKQKLEATK